MKRDLPLEVKGRGEQRGGYVGHADLEGKKKRRMKRRELVGNVLKQNNTNQRHVVVKRASYFLLGPTRVRCAIFFTRLR